MPQQQDPAPREDHHPLVIVFTALLEDQRRRHEELLREIGFEPESRDMPKAPPHVGAYEAVVSVTDHADQASEARVHLAAKRHGVRFFKVTKKTSGPAWEALRRWARELGLKPNHAHLEEEEAVAPQSEPEPPGAQVLHLPVPPALVVEAQREAEQWQRLAAEYDTQRQQAEDALASVRADLDATERELRSVRDRVETTRRGAIATHGELEALRKEAADLREQRNENDRRARTAQNELRNVREELRQLRETPPPPASSAPATSGDLERVQRVANSLWDLVDAEQMDLEEAFIRLAKALGINK